MNENRLARAATMLACAIAAASPAVADAQGPRRLNIDAKRPTVSLKLEYTDFSKLYGDRVVASAESRVGIAKDTRISFSVSAGRRRTGGDTTNATLISGSVDHEWTDRLSTHTSASLANNGSIFAKRQALTDVSYDVGHGFVATLGGKYSDYGGANSVTIWSAGAAYYLRGAALSYRYSLLDSRLLGRSHAHLASFRLNDPRGSGSTQLWVGRGTSLYDVSTSPTAAVGSFSSVALRRQQPLAAGVALNAGVNRTWYKTPTGPYSGTGLSLGLTVVGLRR